MTDDTTPEASDLDDARIYSYLCDFFSRRVVFPGKFDPDDQMNHTSTPSRALSTELTDYLAKHGLSVQPLREEQGEVRPVLPVYTVDDIYLELLADLQKWGAIERWGFDEAKQTMFVVRWGEEWTLHDADEVENWVSGLIDGWLLARAKDEPHRLHQDERHMIARHTLPEDHPDYPGPREPHGEDQAAIDHLERPAPAGEDDPDRGGEDD